MRLVVEEVLDGPVREHDQAGFIDHDEAIRGAVDEFLDGKVFCIHKWERLDSVVLRSVSASVAQGQSELTSCGVFCVVMTGANSAG
jgi:hypothetical protein